MAEEQANHEYDNYIISVANRLADELEEQILLPVNSGVYFSKFDLMALSKEFGAAVNMTDWKKMFAQLFKHVDNEADLKRLLGLMEQFIEQKRAVYRGYAENYKHGEEAVKPLLEKTEAALERLKKAARV